MATGENNTSQKFTISLRTVSGLNFMPAGYCIHPFATRIQSAERFEPMATSHVDRRWKDLLTLFHPKNMTAMKVLSRKKAMIPTVYFPLIVDEALMFEPTETESVQTLEALAVALETIAERSRVDPDAVRHAPQATPVTRVDEARAARHLIPTEDAAQRA